MTDRLVPYLPQLIMDCWDRWSGVRDEFDNRKAFYKERRDAFRKCKRAMVELAQWKAQNNDYEYTIMYALFYCHGVSLSACSSSHREFFH